MYKPKHPAVLEADRLRDRGLPRYRVECSICGQAGSDPVMAEWLVEHGIASISANIDAVAKIRQAVARPSTGSLSRRRGARMRECGLSEEEVL